MSQLIEPNVLHDGDELASRLEAVLDAECDDPSDAYLLACALAQIADDHLARDPVLLDEAGAVAPASLQTLLHALRVVASKMLALSPASIRCRRYRTRHAHIVNACARAIVSGTPTPRDVLPAALPTCLRRRVQMLPNCFRSFDQRPEDYERLVALFSARNPDRSVPLLVVGLRTSGSYLAPLVGCYLEAAGFRAVEAITHRPGSLLPSRERRALRRVVASGGRLLVVDDPPRTGTAITKAANELEALGAPRAALTVLVPLFERTPPTSLSSLDLVVLPWDEWAIHALLREAGAREQPVSPRKHVRGRTVDGRYVRGVGLGYLGRYALAVARSLEDFVPRVDEVRSGLLVREWLPEETRVVRADHDLARHVGRYLGARRRLTALARDPTPTLRRRDAAWGHVASLIGRCFGRLRLPLQPMIAVAARRLARARYPAALDGGMSVDAFFDEQGAIRKVSFEDGASKTTGLGTLSCDPLFDAACLLADAEITGAIAPGFAQELRGEVERAVGPDIAERWLLYELVAYSIARRAASGAFERLLAIERATTRSLQRYFAPFTCVASAADGPLCALDIDGVLESRFLEAPVIGPDAALALRSLACHGYRTMIVTGRSLDELIERCHAYGLHGGAAEYGAVLYDAATGATTELLASEDRTHLDLVRTALSGRGGIVVDPTYRYSVRAYRVSTSGAHSALSHEDVEFALTAAGNRVRAVHGIFQTDFTGSVDKGDGVRALAERHGAPVALAVGDSEADLPMLLEAARAYVPAHAPPLDGIERTRGSYQAGLREACSRLVGHHRCSHCAAPGVPPATAIVHAALRALDGGRTGKLVQALIFAANVARL